MSQFFQISQHASPLVAALRFVPWPAPALVIAPLAGSWAATYGNRVLLVAGMGLHTLGMAWFALVVDASTPYLALCGPLVVSGVGIACVFPTVSNAVVSAVAPEQMGIASGVNGSIRELGGVVGVALAATVFAHGGGYATSASFTAGFTDAMWACTALAGLGLIAALLAAPQRPEPARESSDGGPELRSARMAA
jgi:MFS family permease